MPKYNRTEHNVLENAGEKENCGEEKKNYNKKRTHWGCHRKVARNIDSCLLWAWDVSLWHCFHINPWKKKTRKALQKFFSHHSPPTKKRADYTTTLSRVCFCVVSRQKSTHSSRINFTITSVEFVSLIHHAKRKNERNEINFLNEFVDVTAAIIKREILVLSQSNFRSL